LRPAGIPLLFVQDVSGFMVGPEAEHEGSSGRRAIRRGDGDARGAEDRAHVNHASGAGYYAMAGQGFDPGFHLHVATGRMGVMEGESRSRPSTAALDKARRKKRTDARRARAIEEDARRLRAPARRAVRGGLVASFDAIHPLLRETA
jgi:acetyl-CoA carboxylase carboxyltransferase component